jgi:hypothetical protein
MSIQIITGFTVNNSTPLDNRIVASGAAARNSIPYKYVGLRVFDTSDNRSYYYNGTTFSNEITDQVNGAAGYVPVFTSQNYIGNSGVFQVNSGTERRIGISTNNPTGVYTYMQIGGMSLTEDPSYYSAQSLPLTIHKGGTNVIASNWYYTGVAGGNGYFNSSKGSSLVSLGNEGDFFILNRPGGPTPPVQTIYLSNNNKVGIGPSWNYLNLPAEALDVTGNIKTSGYFKGDGSQITNIISDRAKTASNINVYNAQVSHPAGKLTYMMFSSTASNSNGASVSTYYYNTRGTGFAFDPDNAQLLFPKFVSGSGGGPDSNGPDNPPVAFASTTGIFGSSTFMGFAVDSSAPFYMYSTYSYAVSPIRFNTGNNSNPSITFYGDNDTGIYKSTTAQIGFTTNGTPRMHIKGTNAGNGGVVFTTAVSLGTSVRSPYIQVGSANTSFSTAAAPDYTWYSFTQSGMYMPSANVIAFSTSGTQKLTISQGMATDINVKSLNGANQLGLSVYNGGYTTWTMSPSTTSAFDLIGYGGLNVFGNLYASGAKPFKIEHPHPSKSENYNLVHAAIESSRIENLYRGKTKLSNGLATINLDGHSNMTEGTFVLFNRDPFVMTASEDSYIRVKGDVNGNILTIESETPSSDSVNWIVICERCDINVVGNFITDDNGRLITEQIKSVNN